MTPRYFWSGRDLALSCTATAQGLPVVTMISTDSDHMNGVATVYSHEMSRRAGVMVGKGSYTCHSFVHLLECSLSIQPKERKMLLPTGVIK